MLRFQNVLGSLCVTSLLAVNPALAADKTRATPALAADGAVRVTRAELDALVGNKLVWLHTEEYQVTRRILDEHVAKLLIEREAAARQMKVDALTKAEVEAKIRPVTEEEVRAVYDSAKERFPGQTEEAARAQIADGMRRQRIAQRQAEYGKELRAKAGMKILLEPPRIDVGMGDDALARGPAEAPVTIVEYSDFECPFCARVAPTLKRIEEKYKDRVRLVFRDYPLLFHKDAVKAAEAAHCAQEQAKFWEMHDKIFANQEALAVTDLKRYAAELGLDAAAFDQCLDSGRYEATWRKSMAEAEAYGVTSTPMLFVNGRVVSGAMPFEVFDEIVGEELDRIGASETARARRTHAAGSR